MTPKGARRLHSVPDAERAAWIQADEAAFPAIAAALAVHLSANPSRSDG